MEIDRFDDIKILRYRIPNFEELELNKKLFVYYLSEACIAGRDIIWDQNGKYNLELRRVLESIYITCGSNLKNSNLDENSEWKHFEEYLKKVWFSNGVHHHYSMLKFEPKFSQSSFEKWCSEIELPDTQKQDLLKLIFDKNYMSKRVNTKQGDDLLLRSANNLYSNVSQTEAEEFYQQLNEKNNTATQGNLSWGLNSKLVKTNGELHEQVYCESGLYANSISKIISNLELSIKYAETSEQKECISILIEFYKTGNLQLFDEYNIKWLKSTDGSVDFINGFIETYGDALGIKATWEGMVQLVDHKQTEKATTIANNALWFEQNAPIKDEFKKTKLQGVSIKSVNVAMVGGDCYPACPLGVNLPNAEWIREQHGSKSVTLLNIANAHSQASANSGFLEEFTLHQHEIELVKRYGEIADNLHTHLHECIGHGSAIMLPGVSTAMLKEYASIIEEARADLYGLYFMHDNKMLELELIPNLDVAKAHYISYIRNGLLTQMTRIKLGNDIEQTHMRNRQLIAAWCFEQGKGKVIQKHVIDSRTYYTINDFDKLRELFGKLLFKIQQIKSEGNYAEAKNLIEEYGVKLDYKLHSEVLKRYEKLNIPPFSGFVNPKLELEKNGSEVSDVKVNYTQSFTQQMLEYSNKYSFEN